MALTVYDVWCHMDQAQLQKAARASEKISKGDKNPKDFIVFPKAAYHVTGDDMMAVLVYAVIRVPA